VLGLSSDVKFKSVVSLQAHTKRQATQHGCLPSLLGDGDPGIKELYTDQFDSANHRVVR